MMDQSGIDQSGIDKSGIGKFGIDEKGAAAIDFAMVAPVLIALLFGGLALAFAIWIESGLQEAAEKTARCAAIGSTLCAAATAGCDSALGAVCYAEAAASLRGVTGVTASEVTVNPTNMIGGVSMTTITITYPFSLIGYSFPLVGSSSFPNAS